MELKFANTDKTKTASGWILDVDYIFSILEALEELGVDYVSSEDIEAVLLVANGDGNLLK